MFYITRSCNGRTKSGDPVSKLGEQTITLVVDIKQLVFADSVVVCITRSCNGRTSSGDPDTSWGEDGEHELHVGGDCLHQL